jgi:dihydroorotate dehydrogenase (NAD+) catalytic subunit
MSTKVGSLRLPNPVMPAAGTYGVGTEFAGFGNLALLGAFTTKSLSLEPWAGNVGQNVIPGPGGSILNSVGLRNPGMQAWIREIYPQLSAVGCRIVVSIWGHNEDEVFDCASLLAGCSDVVAVELNLSCPNHRDPRFLVSNSALAVASYVSAATEALGSSSAQVWAKLSPTTSDLVSVSEAASSRGADAVTLVNTLSAMAIDLESRRSTLSRTYGGLSGPPLHPIALRAVHQVHSSLPELPVIGVGGISSAREALGMMAVGASAVQIGTASFADPRAPYRILEDMERWCIDTATTPSELMGVVQGNAFDEAD